MTQEKPTPDSLLPSGHASATPDTPYDIVDPVTGEVAATHGSQTGTVFTAERPAVDNIIDRYIADPSALATVLKSALLPGSANPEQVESIKALNKALDTYPWHEKRKTCGFAGDELYKSHYARGLLDVLDIDVPREHGKEVRAARVAFLRGTLNTMFAPVEQEQSGKKIELVPADIVSEVDLQHELIARALERDPIQVADTKATPNKGTVGKLMQLFNGDPTGIIKSGDFFLWSSYFGVVKPQQDEQGDYVHDTNFKAVQTLTAISAITTVAGEPLLHAKYFNEFSHAIKLGDKIVRASNLNDPTFEQFNSVFRSINSNKRHPLHDPLLARFTKDIPHTFYDHLIRCKTDKEYDMWTSFYETTQSASQSDWQQRFNDIDPKFLGEVTRHAKTNILNLDRLVHNNTQNRDEFMRSLRWYCGAEQTEIVNVVAEYAINKHTKGQSREAYQVVQVHRAGAKSGRTVWIPNAQRHPNIYAQALAICKSIPDQALDLYPITYGGGNYLIAQPYTDGCFMIQQIVPSLPSSENALAFYTDVNIDNYKLPDNVMKGLEAEKKYNPEIDLRNIIGGINRIVHDRPDVYELSDHPSLGKFAERAVVKPSADGFEVIFKLAGNQSIYPKSDEPRITCHIKLTDKRRVVELDAESAKALRPEQKDYLTWLGLRFFESSSIVSTQQREAEEKVIAEHSHKRKSHNGETHMVGETGVYLVFIGNVRNDKTAGQPTEAKKKEFDDTHLGRCGVTLDQINDHLHASGETRNKTVRRVSSKNGNGHQVPDRRQGLIESRMTKVMAGTYNAHLRRELPAGFPHGHQVIEE